LGSAFVQLFSAPHLFEARQQVIGPQPKFFGALKIALNKV
jgi:hypothetical protein